MLVAYGIEPRVYATQAERAELNQPILFLAAIMFAEFGIGILSADQYKT